MGTRGIRSIVFLASAVAAGIFGCRKEAVESSKYIRPPDSALTGQMPAMEMNNFIRKRIEHYDRTNPPRGFGSKPLRTGKLFYVTDEESGGDLVRVYDFDTGQNRVVAELPDASGSVQISRDGNRIFYIAHGDKTFIGMKEYDDGEQRFADYKLLEQGGITAFPAFLLYDDWEETLYFNVYYVTDTLSEAERRRFAGGRIDRDYRHVKGAVDIKSRPFKVIYDSDNPGAVSEDSEYFFTRKENILKLSVISKKTGEEVRSEEFGTYAGPVLILNGERGYLVFISGVEHYPGYRLVYYIPFGTPLDEVDFSTPHWVIKPGLRLTNVLSPTGAGVVLVAERKAEEGVASSAVFNDIYLFDLTAGAIKLLFSFEREIISNDVALILWTAPGRAGGPGLYAGLINTTSREIDAF
jgi:hypothetical protein